MSLIRSAFRILLLLALVAVATSIWLYFDYSRFRDAALTLSDDTPPLEVARGTSLQGIVAEIDGRGLSNAPRPYWRALAWELRVSTRLHAGEYALEPGLSPRELLLRMARGQVIQHNFTIVPGWTFRDLREALAHEPLLNVTLKGLSDRDAMAKIGAPALAPEGRFLPETYAFVKNEDDVEILQSAYHAMEA
jgi:UPF0755 protein